MYFPKPLRLFHIVIVFPLSLCSVLYNVIVGGYNIIMYVWYLFASSGLLVL